MMVTRSPQGTAAKQTNFNGNDDACHRERYTSVLLVICTGLDIRASSAVVRRCPHVATTLHLVGKMPVQ